MEADDENENEDESKSLNVYASNVGFMLGGSKSKKSAFPSQFQVEEDEEDEEDHFGE